MAAQAVEQKFYFAVAACWDSKEQTQRKLLSHINVTIEGW